MFRLDLLGSKGESGAASQETFAIIQAENGILNQGGNSRYSLKVKPTRFLDRVRVKSSMTSRNLCPEQREGWNSHGLRRSE